MAWQAPFFACALFLVAISYGRATAELKNEKGHG